MRKTVKKKQKPFLLSLLIGASVLLGACTSKDGDDQSSEASQKASESVDGAQIDDTVVLAAFERLMTGPVSVSVTVDIGSEDLSLLDDEMQEDLAFLEQDARILVDKDGNWEAAIDAGDGTIRSVDDAVYFSEDDRPQSTSLWVRDVYENQGDDLDAATYLQMIHKLLLWSTITGYGPADREEDITWWQYCATKGSLTGEGSTWTLDCPPYVSVYDNVAAAQVKGAFLTTVEIVLRDAVNLATEQGRAVDQKFVAKAVADRTANGEKGLSYDPSTSEFTLARPEWRSDNIICSGTIVFDPAGVDLPKIREQASTSETPCGKAPTTDEAPITIVVVDNMIVSLATAGWFAQGSTVTVLYDRNLPDDFKVTAPSESFEQNDEEEDTVASIGLLDFAKQVAGTAYVIAAIDVENDTRVVTVEHILKALEGSNTSGVEIGRNLETLILSAVDGPDAGCSVLLTAGKNYATTGADSMVGKLDCGK